MEDLCEKLMSTDLENEEICLDLNIINEVMSRGKTICLLNYCQTNTLTERLSKPL